MPDDEPEIPPFEKPKSENTFDNLLNYLIETGSINPAADRPGARLDRFWFDEAQHMGVPPLRYTERPNDQIFERFDGPIYERLTRTEDFENSQIELRRDEHSYQRMWERQGTTFKYADLVYHFGSLEAAHKAIEFFDTMMRRMEREGDETF